MIKGNFGCGADVLPTYYNFDKYAYTVKDWDIKDLNYEDVFYLDLEKLPIGKFNDNFFDELLLSHVIEHLFLNIYEFMLEIHRILNKNSVVEVRLPFYYPCLAHVRHFFTKYYFSSICSFKYSEKNYDSGQQKLLFDFIKFKRRLKGFRIRYPFIIICNYYWFRKVN